MNTNEQTILQITTPGIYTRRFLFSYLSFLKTRGLMVRKVERPICGFRYRATAGDLITRPSENQQAACMGPVKLLCVLILFHVVMMLTHAMTLEDLLTSTHPTVTDILHSVGGEEGFEVEVRNVVTEATSLRHGLFASVVDFKASRGIVAKICFTDGICWAAKIARYPRGTIYAIRALKLLHQYCPNIPAPNFKGYSEHKLICYFTDWIEGSTLEDKVLEGPINVSAVKIPENIITSLAEFVYNLTTCPIPKNESN